MENRTLDFPIVSLFKRKLRCEEKEELEGMEMVIEAWPTEFSSLPDPVLEEILSRVPAITVFQCKIVSKLWCSIVDHPNFSSRHFSRAPVSPLLIYTKSTNRSCKDMHLVEGEMVVDLDPRMRGCKLSSRAGFSILAPFISNSSYFLSVNANATSCEGLVCGALHVKSANCIYICNPVTGEYANLCLCPDREEDCFYVFIGLGFSRMTQKYQLLRMACFKTESDAELSHWWPEVCTVLDTQWSRVGIDKFQMDLAREVTDIVYVDGAIFWRYEDDMHLCAFDFETGIFQVIPLPTSPVSIHVLPTENVAAREMNIGVLCNSLCVSLVAPDDGHVELWILQSSSWRKIHDIKTKTTFLEHSGILGSMGKYKIIKYLDGGKILMHDWRETFIVYDPVKGTEQHLRILDYSSAASNLQVLPHKPSLVKLRDALNIEDGLENKIKFKHPWKYIIGKKAKTSYMLSI